MLELRGDLLRAIGGGVNRRRERVFIGGSTGRNAKADEEG
jgi:hypothetical protein